MTLLVIAIAAGLVLLVWGADRFVAGASALARNLGVSPLLIGLTIVGFGTSAPEILVAANAAWQGNPGLAVGNAIGSNIANIGLILGATALLMPLTVDSDTLRKEYPLLLAISLTAFALLWDGDLSRLDGVLLLGGLGLALFIIVRIGLARKESDPLLQEFEAEIPSDMSTGRATALFVIGLVTLIAGAKSLVWGSVGVAHTFGVSDLVIGLTIVAIGTSLPELAASIASAVKKEPDIAIGNVIGSNIYNLLAVLSLPGLISPAAVSAEVIQRDLPVMMILTIALYLMGHGFGGQGRINRLEAALLLLGFFGYQYWIFLENI